MSDMINSLFYFVETPGVYVLVTDNVIFVIYFNLSIVFGWIQCWPVKFCPANLVMNCKIISELTHICTYIFIFIYIYIYVVAFFLCLTVAVAVGTSGRVPLRCPLCPRTFVSKANLLVHAKNEHGDDRGPFSCSVCGRIAKNKNSLRVHIYLYHRKNRDEWEAALLHWPLQYLSAQLLSTSAWSVHHFDNDACSITNMWQDFFHYH